MRGNQVPAVQHDPSSRQHCGTRTCCQEMQQQLAIHFWSLLEFWSTSGVLVRHNREVCPTQS